MDKIISQIGDVGLVVVLIGCIIFFFVKYIPQLMAIFIERLKTKDANNDLVLEVVRNNTGALENNTAVITNIKERDEKISAALENLIRSNCAKEKRDEAMARDIAILKERQR